MYHLDEQLIVAVIEEHKQHYCPVGRQLQQMPLTNFPSPVVVPLPRKQYDVPFIDDVALVGRRKAVGSSFDSRKDVSPLEGEGRVGAERLLDPQVGINIYDYDDLFDNEIDERLRKAIDGAVEDERAEKRR
eukprot:scaffold10361_cov76-Skeletonema_dohrnii-CCMP3373.AAC.2